MATDSLRDFLLGAQQFDSGVDQYASGIRAKDQGLAFDELKQKSPSLLQRIQSQDKQDSAAAAAEYNDLSIRSGKSKEDPYAEAIAKHLFPSVARGGSVPLTQEQIDAGYSYVDPTVRQAAASVQDPKIQQKILDSHSTNDRSNKNRAITNERVDTNQGTSAYNKLDKSEDAFREQDYKLKEISNALKANTSLGDNIAFGYIARSIAQEKGPLTDNDIARIQGVTGLQGSLDEFKSKFTGDVYEKLQPKQKQQVEAIIANNAKNFGAKKAEALTADLNGLYQANSRLRDKDGNPDKILKQRLDSYKKQGLPIDFDPETKTFNVKSPTRTYTGNASDLIKAAGAKSPQMLQNLQSVLSKLPQGSDVGQETYDKYMKIINGVQ